MKKIITFLFLILFSFFSNISTIIACSVPPDIIWTFTLKEENWDYKFNLSFNSWSNNEQMINDFLKEKWYDFFKKEWIHRFINERIQNKDNFKIVNSFNYDKWKEIEFKYLEWTWKKNEWISITWTPFLEFEFDIINDQDIKNWEFNIFYNKMTFKEITSFSHFEFYSDVENEEWKRNFDYKFNKWNYSYLIKREVDENPDFLRVNFKVLKTEKENKKEEVIIEQKVEEDIEENVIIENKTNKDDWYFWLLKWKTIQEFFNEKVNSEWWILISIIFSFIFWAIHWLLPWHAKSILWAYVISNKKNNLKNLFILIITTTLSHSIFIFIIAWIFYLLNQWIWTSSSIILKISAVIYILFWIYFLYSTIRDLRDSFKDKEHWESCNCSFHKNKRSILWNMKNEETSVKKTIFNWILFWCNPCLDALLLFVFFLWTWNLFISIISVLMFSLWLWVVLWIISLVFMITQKKYSNNEMFLNISYTIRFILWVFIVLLWINWIL